MTVLWLRPAPIASTLPMKGPAGFTFNFENTATNYQSGDDFHWEWAVGFECVKGLVLGVVGYD